MKRGYRVTLPAEWCSSCVACGRVITATALGAGAYLVQAWATPDGRGGIELRHDAEPCLVLGRLPARPTGTPYDRAVLVEVVVHHAKTTIEGCRCGWSELGRDHGDHVADVYEQHVAAPPHPVTPAPGVYGPDQGKDPAP